MSEKSELQYLIDRVEAMDGKYDEKLDKILFQTTKTNGRVTALESRVEKAEGHVDQLRENKDINKGRDKVIYIITGAVGAMLLSLLTIYFKK